MVAQTTTFRRFWRKMKQKQSRLSYQKRRQPPLSHWQKQGNEAEPKILIAVGVRWMKSRERLTMAKKKRKKKKFFPPGCVIYPGHTLSRHHHHHHHQQQRNIRTRNQIHMDQYRNNLLLRIVLVLHLSKQNHKKDLVLPWIIHLTLLDHKFYHHHDIEFKINWSVQMWLKQLCCSLCQVV